MSSLYECEVRFPINDICSFKKRIIELGGKLIYKYEFNDHYFTPSIEVWNPIEKILRIRHWKYPKNKTVIYFVNNEVVTIDKFSFKRSKYKEGKLPLYSGKLIQCKKLLHDLGFNEQFVLKKQNSQFWDIPKHNFKTIFEYIPNIGWWGELEVEGDNTKNANSMLTNQLELLNINTKDVSYKPISVIYNENINNKK